MRKTITFTVPGERSDALHQRDNGKSFLLTEMPADQAERWALRALFALSNGGADIPAGAKEGGMAALASLGFEALGKVHWADAEPLFAEMMACVQYVPTAAGVAPQAILAGNASQIEEVRTRLLLRVKLFELHTGFSLPAIP